jgi:hypothetical protein
VRTKDLIWYDIGVLIGTAVKAVAAARRLVIATQPNRVPSGPRHAPSEESS